MKLAKIFLCYFIAKPNLKYKLLLYSTSLLKIDNNQGRFFL